MMYPRNMESTISLADLGWFDHRAAYDKFQAFYNFLDQAWGGHAFNEKGEIIVGAIYCGSAFNSAYFNGTQMVFRDGSWNRIPLN